MKNKIIETKMLEAFKVYLRENEKSKATCEKYVRDVNHFAEFVGGKAIDKGVLLDYKAELEKEYAATSANPNIPLAGRLL